MMLFRSIFKLINYTLERIAPTILRQAKEMLWEQQREQAQQIEYQPQERKNRGDWNKK